MPKAPAAGGQLNMRAASGKGCLPQSPAPPQTRARRGDERRQSRRWLSQTPQSRANAFQTIIHGNGGGWIGLVLGQPMIEFRRLGLGRSPLESRARRCPRCRCCRARLGSRPPRAGPSRDPLRSLRHMWRGRAIHSHSYSLRVAWRVHPSTFKFCCKHSITIAAKPHPKSACQQRLLYISHAIARHWGPDANDRGSHEKSARMEIDEPRHAANRRELGRTTAVKSRQLQLPCGPRPKSVDPALSGALRTKELLQRLRVLRRTRIQRHGARV